MDNPSGSDHTGNRLLFTRIQGAIAGLKKGNSDLSLDLGDLAAGDAEIGSAINTLLQAVSDKVAWYESILDSIQFPITVTDLDMRWTFVNRAVEEFLKVKRQDIIGKPCSDWNAGICKTQNCGIQRLRDGFSTTTFEQFGGHFQVDVAYVRNANGDNVGHVEVVQDITQLVKMKDDMADKAAWYESILDAVPFPITVTDMDSRWTFVNRSVESMLNLKRKDIMGHLCSEWKAGICNTDNCGIKRLRSGFNKTQFEQFGGHYNVDCAYVTNAHGEKVGHVEVVTDVTAIVKVSNYLRAEVDRLGENLRKLASGDLNLVFEVEPGDDHTREAERLFTEIQTSVRQAVDSITQMMADIQQLSDAALAGMLSTRADSSRHSGEFKNIVEGINHILDSVVVPINEALRVSSEYAKYNFAARVDHNLNVSGDWIGFRNALNNIGDQVSGVIEHINNRLVDLNANAEEAAASIQDIVQGSGRIAENSSRIGHNASEGAENITQILQAMEDLNVTVGSVSARAEQVSVTAVQASEISSAGMELAGRTEGAMKSITESTDEVGRIIHDINEQMKEIGKIVHVISDISNQTNLLALNAAIEAARAGDAGRGFAVVAAEVKSLAQDSRKSAENIADMITTLQNKAEQANAAISKAGETVTAGTQALAETLTSFDRIGKTIQEISAGATDVASASEEQAASVQEVTASIGEVSKTLSSTSDEAISTAAATEEASAAADQISHIVINLNDIVESVSKEVRVFHI
jgi:methyl-accepting chemotaxis protein